jgi:hypothetical protein
VSYFYDVPQTQNGTGRLGYVQKGGITTYQYTAYDALGRPTNYNQQTAGVTFPIIDTYNLAGMVTDEKYPSLKKIHTDYDTAGRATGVQNSTTGPTGPYYAGAAPGAGAILYAPHGAVTSMPLHNGLVEQTKVCFSAGSHKFREFRHIGLFTGR